MDIRKLNSLVDLYFKKTEEVDGKRSFLKWLKPGKQTYNWEDVTERIYKLTAKIKSLIRQGDRIAQLVIINVVRPQIRLVEKLNASKRGNKGFGSTGIT